MKLWVVAENKLAEDRANQGAAKPQAAPHLVMGARKHYAELQMHW
jgi:hypothetical protein